MKPVAFGAGATEVSLTFFLDEPQAVSFAIEADVEGRLFLVVDGEADGHWATSSMTHLEERLVAGLQPGSHTALLTPGADTLIYGDLKLRVLSYAA